MNLTQEFLDMTYPDKYYKDVIEPAKLGKGPVPGKIEMLSKSQPLKAMRIGMDPYLPKSMQTGYNAFRAAPTKAAATALGWGAKGLGYLASLPAQAALMTLGPTSVGADDMPTGDAEQEYYDYYTKYGDIGEYANLKIPGIRRRKMMMDRRATEQGIAQVAMQKRIQEEEKQRAAAKAKAAAAAAAASSPYSGQGAQGGGGGSNIGGGQQTSRGPVGGAVTHSQARDARGGMSGWGLSRGGLASLYG